MRKAITDRANDSTATAAAVRAELARARKTQADAAAVLNTSVAAIHRRLTDQVEFTAGELHALAAWLGVPASRLLGEEVPA